jgi:hypothetical protein
VNYKKSDIEAHVGGTYYRRGVDYFARRMVNSVMEKGQPSNGLVLNSKVRGSGNKSYEQYITILSTGNSTAIYSECSCPLQGECKHVVAALLAWLNKSQQQRAGSVGKNKPVGLSHHLDRLISNLVTAAGKDDPKADPESYPPEIRNRLIYWLDIGEYPIGDKFVTLDFRKVSILKNGSIGGQCDRYNGEKVVYGGGPKFLRPSDRSIIGDLERSRRLGQINYGHLAGEQGSEILAKVLSTGRCYWSDHRYGSSPLLAGPATKAKGHWQADTAGAQTFELDVSGHPNAIVLPLSPPWFYDPESNQCGPLQSDVSPALTEALLRASAISGSDATPFRKALQDRLKNHKIPLPEAPKKSQYHTVKPKPRLTLKLAAFEPSYSPYWSRTRSTWDIPIAVLDFSYNGQWISADENQKEIEIMKGDTLTIIPRDFGVEEQLIARLIEAGLSPLSDDTGVKVPAGANQSIFVVDDYDFEVNWLHLMQNDLSKLENEGWTINFAEDFPFSLASEPEHWSVGIEGSSGNDWFSLSLGVKVDGQDIDLVPVLLDIFSRIPDDLDDGAIDFILFGVNNTIFLPIGDGRFISLPGERLRPLLQNLFELFADKDSGLSKISRFRLNDIATLEEAAIQSGAVVKGAEALRGIAKKLTGGAKIKPVPVPTGLDATLRPYQREGLNWLQFLADVGLGGILADDMGLGKTMQTLAHMLAEKENGRLNKPCLLVVPTSLIPNWRIEAERFAPSLTVLTLHGPARRERFGDIAAFDVVLTSYALIHRDREALLKQDYHFAIFDEAQTIKNPSANAAKFAFEVTAKQKICLSGTPVENHLEELWSLCHCVAPGLLGERKAFRKFFRTPIEKQGDGRKQAILNRRVVPFLLRRTKDAVATELPQKTETIEHVALEGRQRDLYETVRLAMDKKVRAEINAKGMARSQITVLDALLKLRQTCCDPRLVKLDAARKVTASAKLERLCQMLPELMEDGRRVLLFSQFTSMLALIEESLARLELPYVMLTGQTKDRETPVRRFQAGEIPLFLISLKAGGTGLNLTAADTVIHFDPWWNPAVERQATDRAHRIGQVKPVFVYKLVARGTVEERMIELQSKKATLAEALYDDKAEPAKRLSEEDITWLLAPLE